MIDDATSRSEGRFVQHDGTRENMGQRESERNDPLMLVERNLRTEPSCRQTLDFSSQAAF
jgi:hypothetical protein